MRSPQRIMHAMMHLGICTSILTSCAPTMDSAAIDGETGKKAVTRVACDVFAPITWSSRDTDETIAGIKRHNAAFQAVCGS